MDYDFYTVERLAEMSREDLKLVFSVLDSPTPEELSGEFISRRPLYSEKDFGLFHRQAHGGHWLGKAYCQSPSGAYLGEGYNYYQNDEKGVVKKNRFMWSIGLSPIDGKQALLMDYSAFNGPNAKKKLVDNVRRVRKGLYIGAMYTDNVNPPMSIGWDEEHDRSNLEFFFLMGPVYPWRGPDEDAIKNEPPKEEA